MIGLKAKMMNKKMPLLDVAGFTSFHADEFVTSKTRISQRLPQNFEDRFVAF